MKKVLVISDVHRNFEVLKEILKKHSNVDLKIFLGDFETLKKEEQEKLTKLFDYSVTGNCDRPGISPDELIIEIEDMKILLTHGHLFGSWFKKIDFDILTKEAKSKGVDLVLHGHNHISNDEIINDVRIFNPGSTTNPRDSKKPSYGLLTIEKDKIKNAKIIYI